MSRENFQKYGLIAALIVAGITLPTSIASFMREPTVVNHNYNNTYYNQTYFSDGRNDILESYKTSVNFVKEVYLTLEKHNQNLQF